MRQTFIYVLCSLALLFITACSSLTPNKNVGDNPTNILKSPNDTKTYESFTLNNKLQVLVISDPTTDKAAASIDVNVGSSSDPQSHLGLAHFLEHMLFLGTEQYPEPDAYQKYISEHGGYHNAFTSLEHTNYFFDIRAENLEEALKRFSSQFTSPLFNEEYVEREVNAVHSEYTSKIKSDVRRYFSVIKELLSKNHPYSKFSVGNKSTLVDDDKGGLRQALINFYKQYYSANQMKLVVLGKEPTSTLKNWVSNYFASIPNSNRNVDLISQDFFEQSFLPSIAKIKNIKDTRTMTLAFPAPSSFAYQKEKPISYLSNLIGHEGKGSLLSALKNAQLADSLSAGAEFDNKKQQMILIRIGLTQKGLANQETILEMFFAYIELLKNKGIKELYFNEQSKLLDIAFKFQEKSEPSHLVSALSNNMHDIQVSDILTLPYIMSHFDEKLYREFLEFVSPNNLLVTVASKDQNGTLTTPWYNTPYQVEPLTEQLVQSLLKPKKFAELSMPEPNPFIPDNVDLEQINDAEKPTLSYKSNGLEIWSYPNLEFNTPKSNLFFTLRSPAALKSAESLNLTELYVEMLRDKLNEFTYPAYLAGLNYELYNHMRGLTVKVSGYSDKQEALLREIISTIKNAEFESERFEIKKEKLSRKLNNAKSDKPFQQSISKTQEYLISPSWSNKERLTDLKKLSVDDLIDFQKQFLASLDIAVLNSGNIDLDKSTKKAKDLAYLLINPNTAQKVERAKITKLNNDTLAYAFPVEHKDTGFVYYFQGKNKSFNERAKFLLLSQVLSSDFYNQIRTEKQLGYVVFATNFTLLEVPALAFIVQSPTATAKEIHTETQAFLESIDKRDYLSSEAFERHKQAVLTKLLKNDNTLYERSNRFWKDIDSENFDFDTNQRLAEKIESMQLEEIQTLISELNENPSRKLIITTIPEHKELNDIKLGELSFSQNIFEKQGVSYLEE